jgi:hypothetical protein
MIGRTGRVALYYAPADDDPLTTAAAAWLGRDPSGRPAPPPPAVPGLVEITTDARLYGFHATLKPPMRLRDGATWESFRAAVDAIAATLPPFDLPPLAVGSLGGFLALRETEPSPALQAYCDVCVAGVDHYRAEPEATELARRQPMLRRPAEAANLARWGYPYVFATWFFHMTLTHRLGDDALPVFRAAAEAQFATTLAHPRRVEDIALFVQPAPGAEFRLAERVKLRG